MTTQTIQIENTNIEPRLSIDLQGAQSNFREFSVSREIKHLFLAFLALTVSFVFNSDADARNAGVVKNVYRQLEQSYDRLEVIKQQLDGFPVKNPYCNAPHPDTKEAALAHLDSIYQKRTSAIGAYRGRRTSLHNLIVADNLGGALSEEAPGTADAVADGTYWNKYEIIIKAIDASYAAKRAIISASTSRNCKTAAPAQPTTANPVISMPDPLAEVVMTAEYTDVNVPTSHPKQFCHQDEKDQLLYHLRELRFKARQNAVKARNLETTLREKLAELNAKRDAAFRNADAAAKAGDRETLGAETAKYQSFKAAASKLPAKIAQAEADKRRWRGVVDSIDAEIDKVKEIPVVDCSNGQPLPDPVSDTSYPGVYKHVDNISLVEYTAIDVNITKTCFERVKESFVMRASTELSNARSNRSRWQERLHQAGGHHDLLSHDANASAELVENLRKARVEARNEVAKWTKTVAEAEAIKAKADAIIVEDCSGEGGATQVGRLDPGFSGISSEIPVPALQPYDLPTIPARICSYEELQALRARAAKAREVSAHNRAEWGKRLTTLGKMLFQGDATQAYPLKPEFAAYLDAQIQYDYWSGQQDVSHKVYYDLMERKHEDCTTPENKISIGGEGDSLDGALQDAINNRPVINGDATGGSFYDRHREIFDRGGCVYPAPNNHDVYRPAPDNHGSKSEHEENQNNNGGSFYDQNRKIFDQGGCAYPDFDKIRLHRTITGQDQFDGSEAERALNNNLRGVEIKKKNDHYSDHSGSHNQGQTHHQPTGKPAYNTDKGVDVALPDAKEPEEPHGAVPVPSPNTSMVNDTAAGSKKVSVSDKPKVEVKNPEYTPSADPAPRAEVADTPLRGKIAPSRIALPDVKTQEHQTPGNDIRRVEVETPQFLNGRNVTLSPSAKETVPSRTLTIPNRQSGGGQLTEVPAPPLVLSNGANRPQNSSRDWVQVAPPTLTITPQGGSAADRAIPSEQD